VAADATGLIPDSRAAHFWDKDQTLGKIYAKVLGLPPDDIAWDIYLLFPRGVRWDVKAPAPAYWMHQIFYPSANYLDGRKLRLEVEKLLPERSQESNKAQFGHVSDRRFNVHCLAFYRRLSSPARGEAPRGSDM
jgi:hypothetical protein